MSTNQRCSNLCSVCLLHREMSHSVQCCTVGQQRDTSQVVCARAPGFLLVALLLYEFFLQTLSMKTTDSTRQNEQGLRERNDHAAAAMVSAWYVLLSF